MEIEVDVDVEEVIDQILELAALIGWCIAIPVDDEGEFIDHLIVGTEGACMEIDKTFNIYEIMMPPQEDDIKLN